MKRFFSFFLMVLLLQTCTSSEKEKIERLLVQRAEAFQKKNLALYPPTQKTTGSARG
jgi:hypothetical protein